MPVLTKGGEEQCVGLTAPTETFPPGVKKKRALYNSHSLKDRCGQKRTDPSRSVSDRGMVLTDSRFPGAHSHRESAVVVSIQPS